MHKSKLNIRSRINTALILIVIILTISEVLVWINPSFALFSLIGWIFAFITLTIYTTKSLLQLIDQSLINRSYFTYISLIIVLVIFSFQAFNNTNLSLETTRELSCAIDYIQNSIDYGFRQTCHLGYPARQFIIPSLPSLLFGRSISSLNFGGLIYIIMGFTVFASNAVKYFGIKSKLKDLFIASTLFIPFHIFYFNFLLQNFEQSLYPIGIAFMLSGMILGYLHSKEFSTLILMCIVGIISTGMYTTALALTALIIFYIGQEAFQRKKSKKSVDAYVLLIIAIAVSLILNFSYRSDIKIWGFEPRTTQEFLSDFIISLQAFFLPTSTSYYFSYYMQPIAIITLLAGITKKLGKMSQLLTIWSIGVLTLSIFAQGYSYYDPVFRLFRFTLILPILILVVLIYLKNLKQSKNLHLVIGILSPLIIFTGLFYQINYNKDDNNFKVISLNRVTFINNSDTIFIDNSHESISIYEVDINSGAAINDMFPYFYSTKEINSLTDICELKQDSILISSKNLFITDCSFQLSYIGNFSTPYDHKLNVYKSN